MKKASRHQGIKASRDGKMASWHRGAKARRLAASRRRARGFTLVELMIAVAVLVVIIIATSKIFGTAGKVTSLGQATADVLQETTAIERQIRRDFERLAPNGVFAIRCVSIRNDINVPLGPLLNPALPDIAMIRADQLLFFTTGVQSIQTYRQSAGSGHKGQGTAARVYYGHAFQLPEARAVDEEQGTPQQVSAHDPFVDLNNPLVPWYFDSAQYNMVWTTFSSTSADGSDYTTVDAGALSANQPLAPQWLLTRHAVLLADDGGKEVVFLNDNRSAFTIADDVVRNGRVDAAATQLNDIRRAITLDSFGGFRPWNDPFAAVPDQRSVISNDVLFYPRAERVAPGMHRVDQALTNNVLAGACSSFIVEWTYSNGVGEVLDSFGNVIWSGVQITEGREQPWFGLDADLDGDGILERGVHFYSDDASQGAWWDGAETILPINTMPNNVEEFVIDTPELRVYEAFFGYNRDRPLNEDPTNLLFGAPDPALGYTPWPSAIRITMVLHDPATKLEIGREVQFVISLPNRVQ